jgi:hypothetical protein
MVRAADLSLMADAYLVGRDPKTPLALVADLEVASSSHVGRARSSHDGRGLAASSPSAVSSLVGVEAGEQARRHRTLFQAHRFRIGSR